MALPTRSALAAGVVALVLGAALVGAGVVLAGGGDGGGGTQIESGPVTVTVTYNATA